MHTQGTSPDQRLVLHGHRVLLIVLPILVVVLQSIPLPARAADEWTTVKSPNFVLVGNANEAQIRRVASQLERFRASFARLFSNMRLQSSVPIRVIVFKNDGAFRPFKPLYDGKPAAVSGFFQPGQDVNYIALTAETREERPFGVIFHEYVHALTRNNTKSVPTWFSEGLAEYYSTFETSSDAKKIILGKPVFSHVYYLRDNRMLPLQTLFSTNHQSPTYNEREKKGIFYAQSWALVHFLMQGDGGKYLPALEEYLRELSSGTPIDESFRKAFGTDYAPLEAQLKSYITRNAFVFQEYTLKERLVVESEMTAAPLSEAEAQFYLGDFLLHIRRLDDAEGYLQRAIALDGKLAPARASLGMLRIRQKRFAEARESLEAAVSGESGATNPLVHYYYASALNQEAREASATSVSGLKPETMQLMRTHLKKAVSLSPEFAEAHRLLSYVELVIGEDLKNAETASRRAQALTPGEGENTFMLAQVLVRQTRLTEAKALLESLLSEASDDLRSTAETLLQRVDTQIARAKTVESAGSEVIPEQKRTSFETESRTGAPVLRRRGGEPGPSAGSGEAPATPKSGVASRGSSEARPPRKPLEGELQVVGLMMHIDCAGTDMTLSLKVGERQMKLWAPDGEKVTFASFVPNAKLICGPQKEPGLVRVTYRPSLDGSSQRERGFDGEPVAVEYIKP